MADQGDYRTSSGVLALSERPRGPVYKAKLAPPRPFLVPSFDDKPVEILPSEKPNRKIKFDDFVHILEIENRHQLAIEEGEEDDEESYEIEIVEDDGEADFYLEVVDGEVYYVFETEDDISVDEDEVEEESISESLDQGPVQALQLPIASMMAPLVTGPAGAAYQASNQRQATAVVDHNDEHDNVINEMKKLQDSFNESSMNLDSSFINDDTGSEMTPPQVSEKPSTSGSQPQEALEAIAGTPPTSPPPTAKPSSPVRSILKACPPSPRKNPQERQKKQKGKDKTYTKTYVRAEHFDGEHHTYSWEKPKWTNTTLRSTGKGEELRKGGNLANPITFPKKKQANADVVAEEEVAPMDKEELIRRIKGGDVAIPLVPLPGYKRNQRRLKFSINGARIRDGGDIVKPITKATVVRKPEDVNKVANPQILKATPVGHQVRNGKNLAAPVTHPVIKFDDTNHVANKTVLKNRGVQAEKKEYKWEKPDWAKPKERARDENDVGDGLKPSRDRRSLRQASWCSQPARLGTDPSMKKGYQWEKPDWTKGPLGDMGSEVKQGSSLEKPITFPMGKGDGLNKVVKPERILRSSEKGALVRDGENLAKPITQLPDMAKNMA